MPPLPEGEVVGASDGVGHLIRDGLRPEPEAWERAGVCIVGGGVAGLAAAWRFLRAGFEDFVLLELEAAPGGTARSGSEHGVVPYPWGAHYLPAPQKENRALVTLLDELGVLEGADAEGGDGRVVGAHVEARGFERAHDAPVGVAREELRG